MKTSQVTWILPDGHPITAEVAHGSNLMLAATFEGVPGIDGDCGGCLSCATCHVVVDELWAGQLPPISDDENGMLDSTQAPRQPRSRLSCQIVAEPALHGLVLHVPAC
jgi:ferredoxin, 2Fe-2S